VREIGRVNRVAVLSRDKTDASRGGGVNDIPGFEHVTAPMGWITIKVY